MSHQYLVTGGLGFIGNELVRQLKKLGSVAVLDARQRVAPRIEDLAEVPVWDADITDHDRVMAVVQEIKPEVVFHMAAIHFIPECNQNPERTVRTNLEGTVGILRACSTAGARHLLFASSGAVYADSPAALTEESVVAPVDIYGLSKWHAEHVCAWHAAGEGLPVTLCRLFNNYGPRETNAHIIPEIISQIRMGDELHLGNISTSRDYVHTSATGRMLIGLSALPPARGTVNVVNVGSGYGTTVQGIIDMMAEILGRKLRVVTDPKRFRKADKQVQVADVRKVRELTGIRDEFSLREGLRDLLEFEGLLRAG